MKISVILAHPRRGSFNHAIALTVVRTLTESGHSVTFHDLYHEKFDPILTSGEITRNAVLPPQVARHCTEISAADGIIFVHPNWWGMPPAILNGWVDQVFRSGVAFRFREGDGGEGVPEGLLRAGTAVVFNTSDTPPGPRTRSLRGSSRRVMEDLHLFLLRNSGLPQADVWCNHYKQ